MTESKRVFISSTYLDLKAEHNSAAAFVRALGYEAISMENFPAGEDRPVDKSLEDVRSCHIYVGIIALRYGKIPDGYDKSITHLEYEEAGNIGIPRLLFLLDETTPWPPKMVDKKRKNIDNFRDHLSNKHVIKFFDSKNLNSEIAKSLKPYPQKPNANGGSTGQPIPQILPYLSNRSQQRDDLIEIMASVQEENENRLISCIIHGSEAECHDQFLEKMRDYLLPELLAHDAKSPPISLERIPWAEPDSTVEKRLERTKTETARRLTGSLNANMDKITQAISDHKNLIIYSSLQTEGWQSNDEDLVKAFFEFWTKLSNNMVGVRLFILLCVKYKDVSGLWIGNKMKYQRRNREARRFVERVQANPKNCFCSGVLRELCTVEYRDLDDWIMDYAVAYCDPVKLKNAITAYFNKRQMAGVTMAAFGPDLHQLLSETQKETY